MNSKTLKLNTGLTTIAFRIVGFDRIIIDDVFSFEGNWVLTDLEIENKYFKYGGKAWEILMFGDLICLRDNLSALLNGTMNAETMLRFIEPDLSFILIPKQEQRRHNGKVWNERVNLCEMTILLHIGGIEYSCEKYSITLAESQIQSLVDYLNEMLPELQSQLDSAMKNNKPNYE